jgi:mannose-1-phosphate guanylyltransferase
MQAFIPEENIYIVTSVEYTEIVQRQLPKVKSGNILSEPSRKNTAPCIAYISFKLLQKDPEASLIIAPSDHLVLDNASFERVALQALDFAVHMKAFVTLGIKPTYPNTGYGYIQHEPLACRRQYF